MSQVVEKYGPAVEARLKPEMLAAGLSWPPREVTLLAFKNERILELWAGAEPGKLVRVKTYPFTAASGQLGPKYKEGDRQVPEGVYALPGLNPNSLFHLSILVDYPNSDDVARSTVPREEMGGEIFVHGGSASVGCIAIGDKGIEEVFTVTALVPSSRRRIIISPVDFRRDPSLYAGTKLPDVPGLYQKLRLALAEYPIDGRQGGLTKLD